MANIVFNIALGWVSYYASLPAANDALIIVPLETSGLEADSVLRDYDDLAAILGAANNEQTTMGRKTVTSVTSAVDDTNNRWNIDIADQTWTAATGNAISALLICYDPDTTGGTDSSIIPLTKHDFVISPDGSDVSATVSDWFRASSAA
jgi:hypothetical protein